MGKVTGIAALLVLGGCGPKHAALDDYTGFAHAVPVAIIGYEGDAMEPFISKDGRYLFFNSRNDARANLYFATRLDDQTFTFRGEVVGANSPALDAVASLDTLGQFYFVSTRSYKTTRSTLYRGHFDKGTVDSVALVPGISRQENGWVNFDAEISADGRTLWFDDGRYGIFGSLKSAAIVIAERHGDGFVRKANSADVLRTVNATGLDYAPCVAVNGLELLVTRADPVPTIYRATRPDTSAAFGPPQRVAAASGFVEAPSLSADGHVLYFHRREDNHFVIYVARRR
jgi:WD40 repeat protein